MDHRIGPDAERTETGDRLRHAEAHIAAAARAFRDGAPAAEVAHRLHAAQRYVSMAKREYLRDRIDDALARAGRLPGGDCRPALDEARVLARYL
jgi:DNA-binding FrmR family transcriptional regulator